MNTDKYAEEVAEFRAARYVRIDCGTILAPHMRLVIPADMKTEEACEYAQIACNNIAKLGGEKYRWGLYHLENRYNPRGYRLLEKGESE